MRRILNHWSISEKSIFLWSWSGQGMSEEWITFDVRIEKKKWWCDFIYFVWSSQKIKTPLSEYIIHTPVEWLASFLCFALMVLCYHTLQEHVLSYAYIQVLMCLPINLHCDKHNFYHFSLHSDEHRVCHWTTHTHTYFMYFSLPLVVCIAP